MRRRRLRMLYFALASFWGFVSGSVAVLSGLSMLGRPLELGAALGVPLTVAALVALVGGAIVSLAYREAVRRSS